MEYRTMEEVFIEGLKKSFPSYFIEVIRNSLLCDIYLRYRDKISEVEKLTSRVSREYINCINKEQKVLHMMDGAAKKLQMARFTSDILVEVFKYLPSLELFCELEVQNWYENAKVQIICDFPELKNDLPEKSPYDLDTLLRPAPKER